MQRTLLAVLAAILLAASPGFAGDFTVADETEYRQLKSELQAVQFLARATFAYTETDVDDLATRVRQIGYRNAINEWITTQAALPPSLHEPHVLQLQTNDGFTDPFQDPVPSGASNRFHYLHFAWWQRALDAPDQLRQRMGFALMQIAVINRFANIFQDNRIDAAGAARYTGIVHYKDMLLQHSFGNYHDVLRDVSYHPVMGIFLTHKDNVKPSADGLLLPDENYAREILQLFSMGQFRTNLFGDRLRDRSGQLVHNYTNDDIRVLARVFTGMQYAVGNATTNVDLHDPMEIRNANNHDFDEKVFPNLHLTLPARTTKDDTNANEEINEAIDFIFSHPNVGPHVSRILIQRFVKANPSKRYIRDVARVFNDNGQGQRGDLLAVLRKIFTHGEAMWSQRYSRIRDVNNNVVGLRVRTLGTEHSKLVEPIVRYTQFIKLFDGQPVDPAKGIRLRPDARDLSQLPYEAPSVFSYFRPEYIPPGYQNYRSSRGLPNGELNSPEMQIYTPVFANRFLSLLYRHLHNNVSSFNTLSFSSSFAAEEALAVSGMAADDFSELLERLDRLMCHGSMSEQSKSALNTALINGHLAGNNNASELARLAIFGVIGTPDCAIDE